MGITGKVGGAVARTLLAKGEKVRGIVRNPEKAAEWQKQGAELFKADYGDGDAFADRSGKRQPNVSHPYLGKASSGRARRAHRAEREQDEFREGETTLLDR
jgi:nucleoside-diphosphate-sugar epimerase